MSTVLTRDQIQAVDDRQIEFVPIPEWSPDNPEAGLFVIGLSGTDRDSFEMAMLDQKRDPKTRKMSQEINMKNLRAKLVVRTAVDSDDPAVAKPVFTMADVEWLGLKAAAALQRVYSVAQRLSGLADEEVENLTEELGNDQSGDSGLNSPPTLDTPLSLLPSDTSAVESSPNGESSTPTSPSASAV